MRPRRAAVVGQRLEHPGDVLGVAGLGEPARGAGLEVVVGRGDRASAGAIGAGGLVDEHRGADLQRRTRTGLDAPTVVPALSETVENRSTPEPPRRSAPGPAEAVLPERVRASAWMAAPASPRSTPPARSRRCCRPPSHRRTPWPPHRSPRWAGADRGGVAGRLALEEPDHRPGGQQQSAAPWSAAPPVMVTSPRIVVSGVWTSKARSRPAASTVAPPPMSSPSVMSRSPVAAPSSPAPAMLSV